jgi:hypothetical protein
VRDVHQALARLSWRGLGGRREWRSRREVSGTRRIARSDRKVSYDSSKSLNLAETMTYEAPQRACCAVKSLVCACLAAANSDTSPLWCTRDDFRQTYGRGYIRPVKMEFWCLYTRLACHGVVSGFPSDSTGCRAKCCSAVLASMSTNRCDCEYHRGR